MLGISACAKAAGTGSPPEPAQVLTAELHDSQGTLVAKARVTPRGTDSVDVVIDATAAMPAGTHGVHLHAVGKCEALTFVSAGGHLNPKAKKHGLKNPDGPHAGDMMNYEGGHGAFVAAASWREVDDADGTAIVIHAGADDQMTDPSGNSGARVACGELKGGSGY